MLLHALLAAQHRFDGCPIESGPSAEGMPGEESNVLSMGAYMRAPEVMQIQAAVARAQT